MKLFNCLFILFASLLSISAAGQNHQKMVLDSLTAIDTSFKTIDYILPNGKVMQLVVIDGDTLPLYNLPEVRVFGDRPYGDAEKDKQYRRLRYHVTKVYPYAKFASKKLAEYNEEISKVGSNRKRRLLLKLREQQLREEFTDIIKKMSVTQGRVLVKLIDRETGESTYNIIKEMRGGFKAFIYQSVARLYNGDLKERYDPKTVEEDEMIERIVLMIDAGQI